MKNNLNSIDRTLRLLMTVIIGALFFTKSITGAAGIILLIVGALLMLTSFIGFCPIYAALKISSCKTRNNGTS